MSDSVTPPTPPTPPVPSVPDACAELLTLAKKAFQEKRRKDCLVLTRAILAIDPESKEAQIIENWILSDLETDLNDVRVIIEKARQANDIEMFQRADGLVRSILLVDPYNEKATSLMKEMSAIGPTVKASAPAAASASASKPAPAGNPAPDLSPPETPDLTAPFPLDEYMEYKPQTASRLNIYYVVGLVLLLTVGFFAARKRNLGPAPPVAIEVEKGDKTPATEFGILDVAFKDPVEVFINDEYRGTTPMNPLKLAPAVYHLKYQVDGKEVGREDVAVVANGASKNSIRDLPGKLVFIIVPTAGVRLSVDGKPLAVTPESLDVMPGPHQLEFSAAGYSTSSMTVTAATGKRTMVPVLLKSLTTTDTTARPNVPAPPAPPVSPTDPPASTGRGAIGNLAVSSLVEVGIYEKNKFIGSAPVNLDLTPGLHTLEFRFEGLKKTANYNIEAGSSTSVRVIFEIPVQIQAKPFAEVFIEGSPRQDLGETPLSNVMVPVGGTLIFQYQKTEKRYRVKSTDSAIQMSFP